MDSPLLNFVAAVGIGLVIGVIGGFVLKRTQPNAVWLAPVLAVAGSLLASVIALLVGDDRQYGWKEPILQIALALAGVGVAYLLGGRTRVDARAGTS